MCFWSEVEASPDVGISIRGRIVHIRVQKPALRTIVRVAADEKGMWRAGPSGPSKKCPLSFPEKLITQTCGADVRCRHRCWGFSAIFLYLAKVRTLFHL